MGRQVLTQHQVQVGRRHAPVKQGNAGLARNHDTLDIGPDRDEAPRRKCELALQQVALQQRRHRLTYVSQSEQRQPAGEGR